MPLGLTEADVENLAIEWLRSLGYQYALGSEISPGGEQPLRELISEPAQSGPLREAIGRLNPTLPVAGAAAADAVAGAEQSAVPSIADRRRAGGVSPSRRQNGRGVCAADRF